MLATVQRFSAASADPHILHQHLLASSVVIIEGAATRSTIDEILAEIADDQSPTQPQTFALAAKSPTFATDLLMNPLYIDLVKRILTDTAIIYYEQERTVSISEPQVSATEVLTAAPGAAAWGLRRRDECHHITHPAKRESDLGIMYASTEVTMQNGAVRVVVGSNWWVDERDPTAEEVLVELRKGDALVWYGSASQNCTSLSPHPHLSLLSHTNRQTNI
jgi:ectoine hydroxylase-related dioxygenase (phytanoyl-CoA dioxygenase family)